MYSRAARVTDLSSASTSTSVGPASYLPNYRINYRTEGYAPFLSLSSRLSVFESVSDVSPGPAQYNIHLNQSPVPGGQSLQNRSRRFEEVKSDGPGPAAYNITQLHNYTTHTPSDRGTKKVLLMSSSDSPSIPSPGQALGFEEDQHGGLCRHKPPHTDHSLGPAYYNPKQAEQKCKGVPFSHMTEKRAELKVVEGPGPGHYSPEQEHSVYYENVNLKRDFRSRAELQVPRYHQILTLQEEKKGVPGPGQYDVKGHFEKLTESQAASVCRPAFMSHSQRFSMVKQVSPPVGCYTDPRCALELLNKPSSHNRSPFNSTAARFTPHTTTHTSPGPGAYNVFDLGLARDSLKKACLGSRKKTGFSSSTKQRTHPLITKHQTSPGPAHYTVLKKTEEVYKQKPTAAFSSNTDRLNTATPAKDTPSPTCYNIRESFVKVFGQRQHGKPRTDQARERHTCFLSSAPRDLNFLHRDSHSPGPGHYSPEVKSTPKLALIGSREERFKQHPNSTPGPAAYTLSSEVLDTVLKGTFNVTLQNLMMSQTQAPPPHTATATALTFSSA